MISPAGVLAAIVTVLLVVEGIWIIWTTREHKLAKGMMTTPAFGPRKKICVIFPSYKDTVDLEKWIKWRGQEKNVKFLIAEDVSTNNDIWKDHARIIHRPERGGYKAGAMNYVFDLLVKEKADFDYIIVFDADHRPYNNSIKEIYDYLNKELIQFYWLDGLPLNNSLNWITFSSRYFSDWNIYNSTFPNLTGSSIAIKYDLIKNDGLRFPETITEDYALSLNAVSKRKIKVTVIPFLLSIGSSPGNYRTYVKQQIRWAEGTLRDGGAYFTKVLSSKTVDFSGKVDYLFHMNLYLQGLWVVITYVLLVSGYLTYSALLLPIIVFQGLAYLWTLRKTPKKYYPMFFLLNYFMAVVQVYAMLRAIFVKHGVFVATDKTYDPSQVVPRLKL